MLGRVQRQKLPHDGLLQGCLQASERTAHLTLRQAVPKHGAHRVLDAQGGEVRESVLSRRGRTIEFTMYSYPWCVTARTCRSFHSSQRSRYSPTVTLCARSDCPPSAGR